jgi:hypothetical protein
MLIPELKQLTQEELMAGAAIDIIAKKYDGFAKSQIKTFSGATTQASNAFGDLLEAIGMTITKSPMVIAAFNKLTQVLSDLTTKLMNMSKKNDVISKLTIGLANLGTTIITYVVAPLEMMGNALNVVIQGWRAFANTIPIGLIHNLFSEGFSGTVDVVSQSFERFGSALGGLTEFPIADRMAQFTNSMRQFAEDYSFVMDDLSTKTERGLNKMEKQAKLSAKQINDAFSKGMVKGISTGIQTIATNLALGKDLFEDFGKNILGVLGDLAIQIGEMALATGIAMKSFGDLTGTSLIIAGAGLIAVGSILKAFSAGAGGLDAAGAGAGAEGGGVADTAATPDEETTAFVEDEERERVTPRTNIVVNVQGNIMDRRQTGLEIIEAINEVADAEGAIITAGGLA